MEDNIINVKNPEKKPKRVNINIFIEKIINDLSIDKKIKINGKTLHYLPEEKKEKIINFSFFIYKNTEINPFLLDIILDIELVPNKTPFARVRADFTLPSLYDNRNYFFCLTNEHEFKYNPKNLDLLENLLTDITKTGIENFLFCLNENIQINTFVFYGEYEVHSIYNINDFLENSKLVKLYRVNQIFDKGKEIEEKYIVITQLYFLIFKPQENDRSFAELVFQKKLKNISFNYKKSFNKKLNSVTLILYIQEIKTPNGITYEIEFAFIDRSRPPVNVLPDDEENEDEENETKDDNTKENKEKKQEKVDNKDNTKNKDNNNDNKIINNEIKEEKKEEDDPYDKYYLFEEEIEKKQKEINFNKYKLVIENYYPLFNHRSSGEKKLKGIEIQNRIMEYEKMFQHCEKMYNYYEKLKDNVKYKKRMDYYIVNINFFCAELMGFFDLEKTNFQFYLDKMKYYLDLNEKNQ